MSDKNKTTITKAEPSNQHIEDTPELFRAALLATADGVVITDNNGIIKWVNPAFERLTGYSKDEVKNNHVRILKSGKQNPAFYKELWDTILAGDVWTGELWNKRKDGVIYLEEQSITPVKDDQGNVTNYIAIKRDITQQHEIQNQIHMARRIEAIDQLTAGIAHNFNNKLASILGFAELASDEARQYASEELNECLNEITIAGQSARDLVRQMMAFTQNKMSEPIPFDIKLVIKQAIKVITATLPAEVTVLTNLNIVPCVKIDPVRLHQMLITLAVNANDAMEGHGKLIISLDTVSLDNINCNSCHEAISGNYVFVSIKDTGMGIKPDTLDKIFMPFFTTRQHEGGTGMGLSALHGMLHEMHGHVLIDTVPGQHSEFKLLLPVEENSQDVSVDKNATKDYKKNSPTDLHILLVDDEAAVANFLSNILEIHGYQVTKETSSKKALKIITADPEKYDLLITDQSMPQLSGTELVAQIYEIRQDLPIILITGYQNNEYYKDAEHIFAVLTKPFDTRELINKIEQL